MRASWRVSRCLRFAMLTASPKSQLDKEVGVPSA